MPIFLFSFLSEYIIGCIYFYIFRLDKCTPYCSRSSKDSPLPTSRFLREHFAALVKYGLRCSISIRIPPPTHAQSSCLQQEEPTFRDLRERIGFVVFVSSPSSLPFVFILYSFLEWDSISSRFCYLFSYYIRLRMRQYKYYEQAELHYSINLEGCIDLEGWGLQMVLPLVY